MKTYGEWRYSSTILYLGTRWRWSASRPDRSTPEERSPCTHFIGGWVGPGAGLDEVEKREILARRESNPARPARRYPDSFSGCDAFLNT
jgi:hypothetical protein